MLLCKERNREEICNLQRCQKKVKIYMSKFKLLGIKKGITEPIKKQMSGDGSHHKCGKGGVGAEVR